MALYNNGYRLGNVPFKRGLGALVSLYNGGGSLHTNALPKGYLRGSMYLFGQHSARPAGNIHPRGWMLPQKGGEMSMRSLAGGGLAGAMIPSYPMSIDMTGSGDLSAIGALAVAMAVAMDGTGSLTATINGLLNMSCDLEGSSSMTASMEGIASLAVDMLGQGGIEATIAAYGNMEIDIVVTGTGLTTANIGNTVWQYLINGTEAQDLLSTAGSGGVDYDTLWASMPAALKESLAAYVLAAAQVTPIHSEVDKVNGVTIAGTGVPPTFDADGVMTDPGDPWRAA